MSLAALERVFEDRGVAAKREKSFDLEESARCLGVEVVSGKHLGPCGWRLARIILA